jgi:hypothetical protein
MLIFFDETFRVSDRNPAISLGALCGMRFQSNPDIQPFFEKLQRQKFEYVNNNGVRVSGLKVIRG